MESRSSPGDTDIAAEAFLPDAVSNLGVLKPNGGKPSISCLTL